MTKERDHSEISIGHPALTLIFPMLSESIINEKNTKNNENNLSIQDRRFIRRSSASGLKAITLAFGFTLGLFLVCLVLFLRAILGQSSIRD